MKANELRIGNYIELDGKVESIWEISLDYYDEGFPYISAGDNHIVEFRQCRHEPIPLTKEWLIKFGAKKDDLEIDSYVLSSLTCEYRFFKTELIDGNIYWSCEKVLGDTCIEYVHQLQNLYFALTGEELTIK